MGWDGGNHRWNEVGWGKTNLGWAGKVGWLKFGHRTWRNVGNRWNGLGKLNMENKMRTENQAK
jgi:hypothetical protein